MNNFLIELAHPKNDIDSLRKTNDRTSPGIDIDEYDWTDGSIKFKTEKETSLSKTYFFKCEHSMLYIRGYPNGIQAIDEHSLNKLDQEYNGESWVPDSLNLSGACTIVYINSGTLFLFTDKLGILPIYEYHNNEKRTLGSCFEQVCQSSSSKLNLDYLSIWEFMIQWSIRPPNTIFDEIKELPFYSKCRYTPNTKEHIVTNNLVYSHTNETRHELADQLSTAIIDAVSDQTSHLNQTTLFLSGGFDSRVVAENKKSTNQLAITVTDDSDNYETKIANKIANDLDIEHEVVVRDPDFYFGHIDKAAAIGNGTSSAIDCHFLPIMGRTDIKNSERVLTGCYVDYLFKGLQSDSVYANSWRIFKLNKRLCRATEVKPDPFFARRTSLLKFMDYKVVDEKALMKRLDSHNTPDEYRNLSKPSDYWHSEKHRLLPFSREPTAGTRHMLAGTSSWFPVMSDDRILDVYCRTPVDYKLNTYFWQEVVTKCAPITAKHRNANSWIKPQSNTATTLITKNTAALYYAILRKINPSYSIGSTQNFRSAKGSSITYRILLATVCGNLSSLGFSNNNSKEKQQLMEVNTELLFLCATLQKTVERCRK